MFKMILKTQNIRSNYILFDASKIAKYGSLMIVPNFQQIVDSKVFKRSRLNITCDSFYYEINNRCRCFSLSKIKMCSVSGSPLVYYSFEYIVGALIGIACLFFQQVNRVSLCPCGLCIFDAFQNVFSFRRCLLRFVLVPLNN